MPVNNLDKIDARYIDGTRASHTQVLRVDSNLDVDFEDSIRITNPSGTTGDNGTYYFTPSGEFQTFILNHNNSNIYFSGISSDSLAMERGAYQVRVYNNQGNGSITVEEFEKFAWHGQKPPSTVTIPSGQHYVYAVTYHGDYSSSYPDLKDWSAVFVSESA
tara:strand:+ start:1919 stop:2401 length:483 start_codon:yes stop_codon:yes gene_type:complete